MRGFLFFQGYCQLSNQERLRELRLAISKPFIPRSVDNDSLSSSDEEIFVRVYSSLPIGFLDGTLIPASSIDNAQIECIDAISKWLEENIKLFDLDKKPIKLTVNHFMLLI